MWTFTATGILFTIVSVSLSLLCALQTVAQDHVLALISASFFTRKCFLQKLLENNSIEIFTCSFLTDRNTWNAKIIQATPQNSHIIKLLSLRSVFIAFLFFHSGPLGLWYKTILPRLRSSPERSPRQKPLKFKHIDVTSTTIIKSCCLQQSKCSRGRAFKFKASHENYPRFLRSSESIFIAVQTLYFQKP